MKTLENKTIVVAGGTGNIGSFIVKELLIREAIVAVPSRSDESLSTLKSHLAEQIGESGLDRLYTFKGDIGDSNGAESILSGITDSLGKPDAAVASLGRFIPAPSIIDTNPEDFEQVIRGYLTGHFITAKTFLSKFRENGGTYIFINGPLALEPWENSGAGLVSIATAGQRMLFKTLAQELKNTNARVIELIIHAFVREKQTQPSSPIPGEAVGAYIAHLIADEATKAKGKSIQLRSMDQLKDAGIELAVK